MAEDADILRLERFQHAYSDLPTTAARNRYMRELPDNTETLEELRYLAKRFLQKRVSSCVSCIMEAFVKLMKYNAMEEKVLEYDVYPGVYRKDPVNWEIDWLLTQANLRKRGEELALRHLANDADARRFFSKLPADVDDRIAAYKRQPEQPEQPAPESKDILETAAPSKRGRKPKA